MKKLFFLLCILTAFVACSDNNDNGEPTPPIENLKMPSAETPFTTGQSVTIEGKGFTTNSQIWLRNTTKATGDVQTKVTEVTDNSIVFEVPESVEGKQNVILKQDGKEYKLGEITLRISEEALYAYKRDYSDPDIYIKQIVKIDKNSGTEKIIANLTFDYPYFESPVYLASSKEIIGIVSDQLVKVNIENGTSTTVQLNQTKNTDYQELILDNNGNLYAHKRDYSNPDHNIYIKQIVKIDKNNGSEKIIANLTFDYHYFESPVYLASSKEIIGIAFDQLVKVNIENGTSTTVQLNKIKGTDYDGLVLDNNENLYAYKRDYSNPDPNIYIKQIVKIDKNNGTEKIIANLTFDYPYFENPVYLASSKEIIGIVYDQLVKVNIENGTSTTIQLNAPESGDYDGLVVIRK